MPRLSQKKDQYFFNSVYSSILSRVSRLVDLSAIILRSDFVYLSSRMILIILFSELNSALYCDSTNTSFVVEYMPLQGMAASPQ